MNLDNPFRNKAYTEREMSPERLSKKYCDIDGEVSLIDIPKNGQKGLGISLSGNKDPSKMSVYICGIRPDGAAALDGRLRIGDELLEANGNILVGKSHLNAAPIINGCTTKTIKLVVLKRRDSLKDMAVKPIPPPLSVPVDYQPAQKKPPDFVIKRQGSPESPPVVNSNGVVSENHVIVDAVSVLPESPPAVKQKPVIGSYGEEYTLTLTKGKQGLGFAIMERSLNDEPGIYVKHITPKGPADTEGTLRTGDRLIVANERKLGEATYDDALDHLRSITGPVTITVARPSALSQQPSANHTPAVVVEVKPPLENDVGVKEEPVKEVAEVTVEPEKKQAKKEVRICTPQEEQDALLSSNAKAIEASEDMVGTKKSPSPKRSATAGAAPSHSEVQDANPSTCPIVPGHETIIEIDKGAIQTLGLSIVGGRGTPLNAIVIHEVYETGAAWKDKRLWAGDQILSVDDKDLTNCSHDEARDILVQTGEKVRMRVWRDDKEITENDLYDIETVDIVKKPSKGLGISIVGRPKDEGVLISDILKGMPADADGRLCSGDRILEINGEDVRQKSHADIALMLKVATGKVNLKIGRVKRYEDGRGKKKSAPYRRVELRRTKKGTVGITFKARPPSDTASIHSDEANGASTSTASSATAVIKSRQRVGVFVSAMAEKGPAAKSEVIQIGDELVSINDETVLGKSPAEVREIIKNAPSCKLVFEFRRPKPQGPTERTVELHRTPDENLGFSIVGGQDSPKGDLPIYVKTVFADGVAQDKLKKGDILRSVNGVSLSHVTHTAAVEELRKAYGTVLLKVLSPS